MLQPYLPDCVFLDLFSGSGQIGIEALSRGAGHAYFVENGAKAFDYIRQNIRFTGFEERATLLKQDVMGALKTVREKEAGVIFMDPPYGAGLEEKVLDALNGMCYVTEETLIVAEAALERDFSFVQELGYQVIKEKNYKTNKHVFIKKQSAHPQSEAADTARK